MTVDRTNRRLSGRARGRPPSQGYVLLTLLLFVALLAVAAAAVAPSIAFEIKRDREEELVHRGVEYTRAIQRFAKVNARYPLRLEELQSAGNMKFIRKLYKDPVTGGDFQLLHMSDIRVASGTRMPGDPGYQGSGSPAVAPASAPAPPPADSGGNSPSTADSVDPHAAAPTAPAVPTAALPAPGAVPPGGNVPGTGAGAIVGVASKSTARSIREFARKNHYNDWLFFYLPGYNQGLRITGPTSLTPPSAAPLNGGALIQSPASGVQETAQPTGQK